MLPARPCSVCGSSYTPKGHCGRESLYCSNRCKLIAWKATHGLTAAREAKRAIRLEANRVSAAEAQIRRNERKRRVAQRMAEKADAAQRRLAPCQTCGGPLGLGRKWCSALCAKAAPESKERKASARTADKARRRNVVAEDFSPYEVFARDGWLCRLCGAPTPRAKRGTYEADAPELDHIVPISKGGPHTKANTQCACRACNLAKADTLPTEYQCLGAQPRYAPIQAAAH